MQLISFKELLIGALIFVRAILISEEQIPRLHIYLLLHIPVPEYELWLRRPYTSRNQLNLTYHNRIKFLFHLLHSHWCSCNVDKLICWRHQCTLLYRNFRKTTTELWPSWCSCGKWWTEIFYEFSFLLCNCRNNQY